MKDEKLFEEVQHAITRVLDTWETPDCPELFCYAMRHLKTVLEKIKGRTISSLELDLNPFESDDHDNDCDTYDEKMIFI
jgi:hypothetical protein